MKKLIISILIASFVSTLVISCGGTKLGWIDENTYRLKVAAQWDRERYYIEGQQANPDKEAKPSIILRQLSERAAQVQAMRNFQEQMGSMIKSKTGVEDGKLIGDVIQAQMSGVTIAPNPVGEPEFTEMHDAIVVYDFKATGLQMIIDKAKNEVLKKKNEGVE